ncbi:MAG: hypothetical protein JSV80_08965 [Acidobacteriota bacterium]|nr:MAG: hypothetical protein JSV80_08965 [Acidobacteriota bacterium]
MIGRSTGFRLVFVALLVAAMALAVVVAGDPPDSEINPVTGNIESVDATLEGGAYQIRHVIDEGPGLPRTVDRLTTSSTPSLDPRIAITSNGDTCVTWWEDAGIDKVLYRRYELASSAWGPIQLVSDLDESSRHPEIVIHGGAIWIAYEIGVGAATGIAVTSGGDGSDPFPYHNLVANTSFTEEKDTLIHSEADHLWVTWIDSLSEVGWSAYDAASATWSVPAYESYVADDVDAARERIRSQIVP